MNIQKDQFEKTYLDVINESYHSPLRGGAVMWTPNAFTKIMKDVELGKCMKGGIFSNKLLNEIDNTIVNKKIFSFKKLLKQKPEITTAGQRKKF